VPQNKCAGPESELIGYHAEPLVSINTVVGIQDP
jgi:hypothetical protein